LLVEKNVETNQLKTISFIATSTTLQEYALRVHVYARCGRAHTHERKAKYVILCRVVETYSSLLKNNHLASTKASTSPKVFCRVVEFLTPTTPANMLNPLKYNKKGCI